jgi:hypothetical protein
MDDHLQRVVDDFRVFVFVTWKHLGLPDPTPLQYDIAYNLQHGPKRGIYEAFRGVGKSWLTSAFVCWMLLRNPQLKILVVSASKERADQFSSFVKKLINEIPVLGHLKPRDGQRDSVIAFDVGPALPDHSPSVKSVGITGQITGSRADILIADDVEVPNNSATQLMRDKLSESVKEFDAILKPLPTSRIIYLGTPQTEMSLYNALRERGYTCMVWPALYPTEKEVAGYKGTLAAYVQQALDRDPALAGKPTDPRRFDEQELLERKLSYGRSGFALQFMLDTALSDKDRYPLKVQDLIVMTLNPTMGHTKLAWGANPDTAINDVQNVALTGDRYHGPMWVSKDEMAEWQGVCMAIDPSGRGTDETGYAIVAHLAGSLFVLACGGLLGGYSEETLENLAALAQKHRVRHVLVESNFGDGMYTQLLKPVLAKRYPVEVEEVRSSGQKELRIIETLEPVMSTHRLVIDKNVIVGDYEGAPDLKYSLIYQMTRLSKDKGSLRHDDRLDALALAVKYWTDSMAIDRQKAAQAIKGRSLDAELKRFHQHVLGGSKGLLERAGGNRGLRR